MTKIKQEAASHVHPFPWNNDYLGNQKNEIDILVIDDNPVIHEVLTLFARHHKFQIRGYTEPEDALFWYEGNAERVRGILLDLNMPGMASSDCLARILRENADQPVCIISGAPDRARISTLLRMGARGFFQKPIDFPALENWVYSLREEKELIPLSMLVGPCL